MPVVVENFTKAKINLNQTKRTVELVLKAKKKTRQRVAVTFVSTTQMRKLNQTYRGEDKATDGLSFAYNEAGDLGEVVIAPVVVKQEAKELGLSIDEMMKTVIVHSLLHLLGYSHENFKQQRQMEQQEKNIHKHLKAK